MTRLVKPLIVAATLCLSMTGVAQADTKPMRYTADCGAKELRMKKGSYDVSRAGVIKGDSICEYQFYAKKGQKVSASLVGNSDLYPMLYGTTSEDLTNTTVTLGKTGEHTIRVLQPRNQAREGNTPKPYYLTVTIK